MRLHLRLALAAGIAAALSVLLVLGAAYYVTCRRAESVMGQIGRWQAEFGWPFLAVAAGGLVIAAVFGWLAARASLRPLSTLTATAGEIARTRDLGLRIDVTRDDEIGKLAASFNTMLDALERSAKAQKQLVADASHELRSPLTAVRTNAELLVRGDVPAAERDEVGRAVVYGLEELSGLVSDLVELARDEEPAALVEDVRLDEIVTHEVARAGLHWAVTTFTVAVEPTVVRGVPDRLARAVGNLLDNAAKYGAPDDTVEVTLREGVLEVRDHGPGIPVADLPFVFDRFYRADEARAKPGSGLGLAIVRQVVDSHGGTVSAVPAPDGGTLVRLVLPAMA
ncbi:MULTISPECIES: sensor histidine kinase [unclassified Nonomuraea]|uniref:sensor histidine kinase n=1 Tax=Nonomuraea sp. NPDC003804 TaxID=3154547 RepID=UPI0033A2795A